MPRKVLPKLGPVEFADHLNDHDRLKAGIKDFLPGVDADTGDWFEGLRGNETPGCLFDDLITRLSDDGVLNWPKEISTVSKMYARENEMFVELYRWFPGPSLTINRNWTVARSDLKTLDDAVGAVLYALTQARDLLDKTERIRKKMGWRSL